MVQGLLIRQEPANVAARLRLSSHARVKVITVWRPIKGEKAIKDPTQKE
jgi:hypothetical protein